MDGKLRPIEGAARMTGEEVDDIVRSLLDPAQVKIFEENMDVDFSFSWEDKARLRASAFTQRGLTAIAVRMIPTQIPTFEQLGLPPVAEWVATLPRGLVLVTGPTGSGKSTTLASILDRINATRSVHILTIEDPVEYVHNHKVAAVSQREVGLDSPSFDRALRSALREDPDVMLLGEMRDPESIQVAITMAETGHLVFATLAHQRRPPGHRPDHRRLPGLAPGADPGAARRLALRRHRPATVAPGGRRSGGGVRGPGGHAPRAQPDPGRQVASSCST